MLIQILKVSFYLSLSLFILLAVASLFFYLTQSPSNDRHWEFGQQVLQQVEFDGDQITIKDLRDYDWGADDHQAQYRDKQFALDDIESIEVGVSHFSVHESIAHVFIVFGIKDQEDIGLSVEARRSVGEDYTISGGLRFSFDLAYFLTSKQDLLSIRQQRNERVYLFKTIATPDVAQDLFKRLADRVNQLYATPEFYHILFKNCASLVVAEVEKISDVHFPFYEKTFAPGFSGKALFEMGLLDTQQTSFSEVKSESLVTFESKASKIH
ncbi:MAG: DUF4105 domain-containing protein [Arenicella sp.]